MDRLPHWVKTDGLVGRYSACVSPSLRSLHFLGEHENQGLFAISSPQFGDGAWALDLRFSNVLEFEELQLGVCIIPVNRTLAEQRPACLMSHDSLVGDLKEAEQFFAYDIGRHLIHESSDFVWDGSATCRRCRLKIQHFVITGDDGRPARMDVNIHAGSNSYGPNVELTSQDQHPIPEDTVGYRLALLGERPPGDSACISARLSWDEHSYD